MKARAIPRPLRGVHETGCVVCGRPLVYSGRTQERECCVCHRVLPSDAVCEAGHFVCDDCHSVGGAALLAFLQDSRERDPVKLFLNACALPGVHMHGPEHHGIVPCVLLTACANCGLELDLPAALAEAWARGKRLPGGSCGALGVCGAAAGAVMGFLRFNSYPASVFMGDTGSFTIGGALVAVCMLTRLSLILPIIALAMLASSVSDIIQVGYFKYTKKKTGTGKRVFRMAPLHHHFELGGMPETRIVAMYMIVTTILCLLTLTMFA